MLEELFLTVKSMDVRDMKVILATADGNLTLVIVDINPIHAIAGQNIEHHAILIVDGGLDILVE